MDIHLAVQKVEERFDYEGNELSTEAWNTIRAFIAEALKPSHNNQGVPTDTEMVCAAQIARLLSCIDCITDSQRYHYVHSQLVEVIGKLRHWTVGEHDGR